MSKTKAPDNPPTDLTIPERIEIIAGLFFDLSFHLRALASLGPVPGYGIRGGKGGRGGGEGRGDCNKRDNRYTQVYPDIPNHTANTSPPVVAGKKRVSKKKMLAVELSKRLGCAVFQAEKQIDALVTAGWSMPRVARQVEMATAGMPPWEWTRGAMAADMMDPMPVEDPTPEDMV